MRTQPCGRTSVHGPHTPAFNTVCPGVFDRPTLDEACTRLGAYLLAGEGHGDVDTVRYVGEFKYELRRSDLAALLATVGWNVTADEAREDAPPEAEQEALL